MADDVASIPHDKREIGIGIAFIAVSVLLMVWVVPTYIGVGRPNTFSPQLMPYLLGWTMLCSGAALIVASILKPLHREPNSDAVQPWYEIAALVASLVIYAILFKPLGAILTGIFVLLIMMSVKRVGLIFAIPFSIGAPILVYLLFRNVLNVPLPRGPLTFF